MQAAVFVALVDVAILSPIGIAAALNRPAFSTMPLVGSAVIGGLTALTFAATAAVGTYLGARPLRSISTQCFHALLLWGLVLAGIYALAAHLTNWDIPLPVLVLWFAAGSGGIVGLRLLLRDKVQVACHPGRFTKRVALVGSAAETQQLSAFLERPEQRQRYTVVGIFIDDAMVDSEDDVFQNAASLPFVIGAMKVDMVIAAPPWADRVAMSRMCERLRAVPANVHLLTEIADINPVPLAKNRQFAGRITVELWNLPLATWRAGLKRVEDVTIGVAILAILAPMMAFVALLIRLESPGPVIFRQMRYGFANRPIRVTKFRTMRHDLGDAAGAWATVRNDPRVTRVGKLLRRTSLDELPQLFDVLRGDMSLVGPRAHPIEMRVDGMYYADAVASYAMRHLVKPGITGLAQINGSRGHVDTRLKAERRVNLDLEYIETWSLGLDLWILWRSALVGFVNENAY